MWYLRLGILAQIPSWNVTNGTKCQFKSEMWFWFDLCGKSKFWKPKRLYIWRWDAFNLSIKRSTRLYQRPACPTTWSLFWRMSKDEIYKYQIIFRMDKRKTYIMIVTPTATSSKKDLKIYCKMCWDFLCANLKNNTDTFNELLLHLFLKKNFLGFVTLWIC